MDETKEILFCSSLYTRCYFSVHVHTYCTSHNIKIHSQQSLTFAVARPFVFLVRKGMATITPADHQGPIKRGIFFVCRRAPFCRYIFAAVWKTDHGWWWSSSKRWMDVNSLWDDWLPHPAVTYRISWLSILTSPFISAFFSSFRNKTYELVLRALHLHKQQWQGKELLHVRPKRKDVIWFEKSYAANLIFSACGRWFNWWWCESA